MITYKDLSLGLKIPIIMAYIVGTIWIITFLIGFTLGILEA